MILTQILFKFHSRVTIASKFWPLLLTVRALIVNRPCFARVITTIITLASLEQLFQLCTLLRSGT